MDRGSACGVWTNGPAGLWPMPLPAHAGLPHLAKQDRPGVMAMGSGAGTAGRPLRRLARLFMRPNKLRRPADRVEAVIVGLLSAAFLAAAVGAPYLGMRIYRWERVHEAHLHPAVAVLSQRGPTGGYLAGYGLAAARWRVPDGQWRSGTLTTENAPGISGAPAGARARVWLNGSGELADPPGSPAGKVFTAVVFAFDAVGGTGIVLIICYWLCRLALDRRRLAAWESAWARTGPRWTTRQG
jgi:hypothetical protein